MIFQISLTDFLSTHIYYETQHKKCRWRNHFLGFFLSVDREQTQSNEKYQNQIKKEIFPRQFDVSNIVKSVKS